MAALVEYLQLEVPRTQVVVLGASRVASQVASQVALGLEVYPAASLAASLVASLAASPVVISMVVLTNVRLEASLKAAVFEVVAVWLMISLQLLELKQAHYSSEIYFYRS